MRGKAVPRVVLDVGPAVHQQAGLARYAERLAAGLADLQNRRLHLELFYNAHSDHRLPPVLSEIPHQTLALGQYPWRLSAVASQLLHVPYGPIQRQCAQPPAPATAACQGGLATYHATEHLLPHLTCPTVLTVHDLIFARFPQHHTAMNRLFLALAMPYFVRAATAVIAVSRQTKADLVDRYAVPSSKVTVIYEGVDSCFVPLDRAATEEIRRRYSGGDPYLLMVGTLEPRKNHMTAVRALAALQAKAIDLRLVIVGGEGWLFESIRSAIGALGLGDRVTFTGYVPNAELPLLYAGADCFLQPSLYEGFGLPVLEAMACGTPVVCSNASSLAEIAEGAALKVPPQDVAAWSHAIGRVLREPGLASHMRQRGLCNAARFRWTECVRQTLQVYESVSGG